MAQFAKPVSIPLLNPNEPEAKVVSLAVHEGQFVSKNSVLCTLETTKSTAEVVAEIDGEVSFGKMKRVTASRTTNMGKLEIYIHL